MPDSFEENRPCQETRGWASTGASRSEFLSLVTRVRRLEEAAVALVAAITGTALAASLVAPFATVAHARLRLITTVWHVFGDHEEGRITVHDIAAGAIAGALMIGSILLVLVGIWMCVAQARREVGDWAVFARQGVALLLLVFSVSWIWTGLRMQRENDLGDPLGPHVHTGIGLWVFVAASLLFAFTTFSVSWRSMWES